MKPSQMIDLNGRVMPIVRLGATQVVDGSSASAQSTVIDAANESVVRIACVDDIHIAIATDPTATTSSILLPAGSVEYVAIPAGSKIAALGGKANITVVG